MSNTINTRTNIPPNFHSRPAFDTRKQQPKDTNPLSGANTGPLAQAPKPAADEDTESQATRARTAAEGLVSTTFIEPILKQMRESNNTPPPFGPSNAEKQFASLLDTKLADEIVHAANFPLVERITAQLLKNMPAIEIKEQSIDIKG